MSHVTRTKTTRTPPKKYFRHNFISNPKVMSIKKDLWRGKTDLLNLRLCKVTRAKVLLEPEFDTEDQVLC